MTLVLHYCMASIVICEGSFKDSLLKTGKGRVYDRAPAEGTSHIVV